MKIDNYILQFAVKSHRYQPYSKAAKPLLLGNKPYSLSQQDGYDESEYLPINIMNCVQAYSNNKDIAISLFQDFVKFLQDYKVPVPEIDWPPIPVSNTFERLMFIAKYLQDAEHRISDIPQILWVSPRTVEEDLSRLRGINNPIQVCGKVFSIHDTERVNGRIQFASTAHPLFLAENLTQVLIILKGLKTMSENPLYRPYAYSSAAEIWNQLSSYAKQRIRFVLSELMPEDYRWYLSLSASETVDHFHTEKAISCSNHSGPNVMMDCIKNGKAFCVEYQEGEQTVFYDNCEYENGSYCHDPFSIIVNCSAGRILLLVEYVKASAYTVEELINS